MKKTIAAAIVVLSSMTLASAADEPGAAAEKLGWQLGVHSYTFNRFTIFQAIEKTQSMGMKYMGISGSVKMTEKDKAVSTMSLSDAQIDSIKKALSEAGIKLVNMGVVQLPPDEAKSRKVFEFARKIGIDTLIAEPEPKALDTVEKLCKEFNIKVAFHNHPKPSRYWDPDTVLAAVKGRTPLMGACADTGHWMRSGIKPLDAVRTLKGRIICFHFKDLNEMGPKAHDVPWGTGAGEVEAVLTEMKNQDFHGAFCVEYEYHWENSVPEITQSAKFFNEVAARLAAGGATKTDK